jgi:hypothetical protein
MEYPLGNGWIWKQLETHIQVDKVSLSPESCVFVLGASGIGKTFTVGKVCSDVDVCWIHSHNCSNAKEFHDILEKRLQTNLVQRLTQTSQKRVIVIDELDTLLQLDRNIMTALNDMLEKKRSHQPVICIGHHQLEKKIKSTFPKSQVFVCTPPSETEICLWLRKVSDGACSYETLLQIADACNGNVMYALQLLEMETKTTCGDDGSKMVGDKMDDNIQFQRLFQNPTRDEAVKILLDDPWLNPLRFHENLPKELTQRKGLMMDKERFYYETLEALCEWDSMMKEGMEPMIAIEHVASMVVQLQRLEKKKRQTDVSLTDFTKVFSSLSLQKKHEKLMYSTNLEFPWSHAQIFCDYIKYR